MRGAVVGWSVAEKSKDATVEVTVSGALNEALPQPSTQAMLVAISGPSLGQRVLLAEQPVEIGRGVRCTLVLDSDSVSRRHAIVEWTGDHHRIRDLGSTNGTYINEARVPSRELVDGDRIQIGKVVLKFLAGGNIESAYHEEIQRLMRYDGLTGIPNRSFYEDGLRAALLRDRGEPMAISLIVFDLDHFKAINDRYGHVAGDAVLRQLAARVSDELAKDQLVARLGGEEFVILWPGAQLIEAQELAERVRKAIAREGYAFDKASIGVTVSLGVAERAPGSKESAAAVYERADERLYMAKSAGRNCVR